MKYLLTILFFKLIFFLVACKVKYYKTSTKIVRKLTMMAKDMGSK